MRYTMIDEPDGSITLRAELKTVHDYNDLIKKLFDKRDALFHTPKKEEPK